MAAEARFRRLPCVKCWRTARTQRCEIAAEKINAAYVSRVLRLTLTCAGAGWGQPLQMALALGLSAAMNQPIGPTKFGVFRM